MRLAWGLRQKHFAAFALSGDVLRQTFTFQELAPTGSLFRDYGSGFGIQGLWFFVFRI